MKAAGNANTRLSKTITTKATTTEIDELFASKGDPTIKIATKSTSSGSDKALLRKNDDGFSDSRGGLSSRFLTLVIKSDVLIFLGKRTEDGLPIYSVEELGIGRGGSLFLKYYHTDVWLTPRQTQPSVRLTATVAFERSGFSRSKPRCIITSQVRRQTTLYVNMYR